MGVIVGMCNGVELFDPKHVRHVDGVETPLISEFPRSHKLVIIPVHCVSFCQPGDSGSLVYGIEGRICNLLYGELDDKVCTIPGLVTTFPDIRAAIKV
jgi:hypothetical protein